MDVVGLDDYSTGTGNIPFLSQADVRLVNGDINNATFLSGLFAKHDFDIVYHTAQVGGSALSNHYPSKVYEYNLVRNWLFKCLLLLLLGCHCTPAIAHMRNDLR
jgi:UDP-glucose 4-epimerase